MKIACAHCKATVEVEDLLGAAQQACPHCGHFVMGGGDAKAPPASVPPWEAEPPRGPLLRFLNWALGNNPFGLRTLFMGERVILKRGEMERLPAVCMRCGAPATRCLRRSFLDRRASDIAAVTNCPDPWLANGNNRRHEPWVQVDVPLCDRHAYHFFVQNLVIYLAVIGIVGSGAGAVVWKNNDVAAQLAIPLMALTILASLACLFMRGIRAGSFFDEYVEIWGVSPVFVRALAEQRQERLNKDVF